MKSTKECKRVCLRLAVLTAIAAMPPLAGLCMAQEDLYLNTSSSLPYGIYHNVDTAGAQSLKINDLALVCLNRSHARTAFERGYIGFGRCTDGTAPVGKHVVAIEGDNVRIDADGIHVNNKLVDYSQPASTDSNGRALEHYSLDRILHENEYILANMSSDSYDSRYFGPVSSDMIIGKLNSLVTV